MPEIIKYLERNKGMKRQRGALWVCLLLLIGVAVFWEQTGTKRTECIGGCMEGLCFKIKSNMSQQELRCFWNEEEKTNYLFLPSYANMGNVTIFLGGGGRKGGFI